MHPVTGASACPVKGKRGECRRYYLDLPGAEHFAPYEGNDTPEPTVARVTLDFLDFYLLAERDPARCDVAR